MIPAFILLLASNKDVCGCFYQITTHLLTKKPTISIVNALTHQVEVVIQVTHKTVNRDIFHKAGLLARKPYQVKLFLDAGCTRYFQYTARRLDYAPRLFAVIEIDGFSFRYPWRVTCK